MSTERDIEKLRIEHPIEGFECGREELNRYLLSITGESTAEDAPARLTKGLAHPVPVMRLARLAVDLRWQGQGVGQALLKDAMRRTRQAADIAGIRAFAVHAKNESARKFYEKFDVIPSPTDPLRLFILLKEARRIIANP